MDPKLQSLCDEVDRAGSVLAHKTEGVRRRLNARELEIGERFLEHTAPKPHTNEPSETP